ncbi:GSCFA domain-containing protein [Methylobacterium sp. NMS14P]|uniref:GSCFA domain-containing protein n=1 Tax=Methylobacterium sp. NMS14P TaxID=2894310 RepID=UPI0023587B7E|nr:GSCFA domain-containing protein [Methylobacterium sp. NMS14P]WCS26424.1 GSCFA domain-containing protein [Methylobacterium sp. NMS14P]
MHTAESFEVVISPDILRKEEGHLWLYGISAGSEGKDATDPAYTRVDLFEDALKLGPADALHDDIRSRGGGRFSHWKSDLYFSTSDNSSPLTNGRTYTLRFTPRDPEDLALNNLLATAAQHDGESHRQRAAARDILLEILDQRPDIFASRSDVAASLIRTAAERCIYVGPLQQAVTLLRKLVMMTGSARDYALLSEALASSEGDLDESARCLEQAMRLDPDSYDTDANREAIRLARLGNEARRYGERPKKVARYPQTADFHGNLADLIVDHIAPELRAHPKFIGPATRFFTMGSCFARNLSDSLRKAGLSSQHLELTEHVNTTFANRAFVDWLRGADSEVGARFAELAPAGWSAASTLAAIATSDVFILTLGVAAAFFDRHTGAFALPRSSALSSRALANKYVFRTTTVQENVDNVAHLIDFVRSLNPNIKIVLTVSPVPLMASFEFESCVQADCLSKSTMRLVAHEIVSVIKPPNTIYWPSFEVFRWAGSNASTFFGADDGASTHVSDYAVSETIRAFGRLLGQSDLNF